MIRLGMLPEGEIAWALVALGRGKPARVFIADVANRREEGDALVRKITASMGQQNARKSETELGGVTVTVFDVPASGNLDKRKLVHFQKDDQLVFTETVAVAQVLLKNLASGSADSLGSQAGYQQVVKQCRDRAGDPR